MTRTGPDFGAAPGPVAGGALIGACAVVPLWALEVVLLARAGTFPAVADALLFALFDLGLLLVAATMLGALQGVAVRSIGAVARWLSHTPARVPAWETLLYTAASVPAAAYLSAHLFEGRRAKEMSSRHLIAVGVGLCAVALFAGATRLALWVRARIRRAPASAAAAGSLALLGGAGALVWTDGHVLLRLYPPLHMALCAGALILAELAVAILAMRRPVRASARFIALGLATAGLCATVTGLEAQGLRAIVLERAPLGGKVLAALPLSEAARPRLEAGSPSAAGPPLPLGPRRTGRDIVLITVDALRGDRLGGSARRGLTPNLDRLAAASTVFSRAYCQVPHTSFSIATLLTGQYVHARAALGLPTRVETLPELLRRFGYKTAGFFPPAVFFIDRERFREYEDGRYGVEYVKYEYLDGRGRTDQVLAFLRGDRPSRVFIWVHYFEPHEPYLRHQDFDFGPSAQERYDGEVAATDREIGRLLEALDRLRPGAIVAVTADHGEEFGEHGGHYHGTTLYDEQARVPLILRVPGVPAGRVAGPVGTVDLAPTLLSLVDIPPPAAMTGTDLGPWLAGADPSRLPAAFSEVLSRKMAASGRHKLIVDFSARVSELYDLEADPAERHNLADAQPRRVAELRREIERRLGVIAGGTRTAREAALSRARAGDPAALPEVLEVLREGDSEARREAAALLFALVGPAARADLESYLEDADPEVAHRVSLAAARLGVARALQRTRRLLERADLPPTMRRQAALALAERGYADGLQVLIEATAAVYRFEDRQAATLALGSLRDARAVPALVQLLRDVRLRRFAVAALGRIGDPRAVEALLTLLERDRFISVREAAARALGEIGDRRAARTLVTLLAGETERSVIAEILTTLARLDAIPAGAPRGRDLWIVLRAERAGPTRVSSGGADLGVLEIRAGVGAYLIEGVSDSATVAVSDAKLLGTWR